MSYHTSVSVVFLMHLHVPGASVGVVFLMHVHVHGAITFQTSGKRLMSALAPFVRGRPSILLYLSVRGEFGTATHCAGIGRKRGFSSGNNCQFGDICKCFTIDIKQVASVPLTSRTYLNTRTAIYQYQNPFPISSAYIAVCSFLT
jgi:hypothetical protein